MFLYDISSLIAKGYSSDSEHMLVNAVVFCHAVVIVFLVYFMLRNMFYFRFKHAEAAHAPRKYYSRKQPAIPEVTKDDKLLADESSDTIDL